ncbi:MAG: amidohydrolase [Clostridiales bacterium]|nr:amidohydrolase [Clostridiales bacterium]
MLTAIDTHCHIHYGPKENLAHNGLSKIMQEGNLYTAYPDQLMKIRAGAHIGKVFASPFDGVLDCQRCEQTNEDMLRFTEEYEDLYQWVVMDPRNDATFIQAERILKTPKCVGIKLHPVCHQYSLEEYGDKVFSFADQCGAVVQIHPEKAADFIVPFADRYPNATFIMAHLGNEHHIDAARKAKHGNVYVDTSGMASLKNMLIEYAVSQIGSERILFGTDTYSAASQRGRIEFALISDQDKENILVKNATRLFHI